MKNFFKKLSIMLAAVLLISSLSVGTVSAAAAPKLNKTKITLNVKKSYQLKLTNNRRKVKWSSSKKSVATVNSKGKVTAKKKGTARITAKVGSKKYTCKVTVKQPVTSLKLNKKSYTLNKKGASVTLKASAKPSSASNKAVTWKSSNKNVATVSKKGKVTAVGNGKCTITATAKDGSKKKATCKITVKIKGASNASKPQPEKPERPQPEKPEKPQPPKPQVIRVNSVLIGPYTSLHFSKVGETSALTAYVVPSNATNTAVTWKSSNNAVATVSSSGVVTAVGNGNATITLTSVDGGKTATCSVSVNIPEQKPDPDPEKPPVEPENPAVENVTLKGGDGKVFGFIREETGLSVPEFKSLTFDVKVISGGADCIEILGTKDDEYRQTVTIEAHKTGNVKVTANYKNAVYKTWNVTVTSNWDVYMRYENWKNGVKKEICPSGSATVQTLDALRNYIRTNFTYATETESPGASNKYYAYENMKCDCVGASGMFGDIASDFGFKVKYVGSNGVAYDFITEAVSYSPGHVNNSVWINGAWVSYDAQPPHYS